MTSSRRLVSRRRPLVPRDGPVDRDEALRSALARAAHPRRRRVGGRRRREPPTVHGGRHESHVVVSREEPARDDAAAGDERRDVRVRVRRDMPLPRREVRERAVPRERRRGQGADRRVAEIVRRARLRGARVAVPGPRHRRRPRHRVRRRQRARREEDPPRVPRHTAVPLRRGRRPVLVPRPRGDLPRGRRRRRAGAFVSMSISFIRLMRVSCCVSPAPSFQRALAPPFD
eukprot:18589-Pelagococcus_subviridis.AAC.1